MDLMDLALQYHDYAWAAWLAKQMKRTDEPKGEGMLNTLFCNESVAVEPLLSRYAVKAEVGIRSFNVYSDFDRNNAEVVFIEQPPYSIGDTVRYYTPSNIELAYLRGMASGYITGYREAYRCVNMQYSDLYSLLNRQPKAQTKRTKTQAKKQVRKKRKLQSN